MIETVDHIIIVVEDLHSAEENYTKILGLKPVWRGAHDALGTSNVLFNFENTYLELLSATGSGIGGTETCTPANFSEASCTRRR